MIEVGINKRDGFGAFLGAIGRVFRRKGEEASREVREIQEPQSEAEEALFLAMGYAEPDGDGVQVVERKIEEALKEA